MTLAQLKDALDKIPDDYNDAEILIDDGQWLRDAASKVTEICYGDQFRTAESGGNDIKAVLLNTLVLPDAVSTGHVFSKIVIYDSNRAV